MVGSYPLLSQAPTPVEVELGCDNSCHCKEVPVKGRGFLSLEADAGKRYLLTGRRFISKKSFFRKEIPFKGISVTGSKFLLPECNLCSKRDIHVRR